MQRLFRKFFTSCVTAIGFCVVVAPGFIQAQRNLAGIQDNIVVDKEGNRYAVKTFADGIQWMTTELKTNLPGSYTYDNKEENGKKYGLLYTWEAANNGCRLLGEGWQLPAKDDWQKLTAMYGEPAADLLAMRKKAYQALISTGNSGFNATMGGNREPGGGYARLDAHGFYWASTEDNNKQSYYSNFAKGSQALFMQDGGEKERAFSVRCVKYLIKYLPSDFDQ